MFGIPSEALVTRHESIEGYVCKHKPNALVSRLGSSSIGNGVDRNIWPMASLTSILELRFK